MYLSRRCGNTQSRSLSCPVEFWMEISSLLMHNTHSFTNERFLFRTSYQKPVQGINSLFIDAVNLDIQYFLKVLFCCILCARARMPGLRECSICVQPNVFIFPHGCVAIWTPIKSNQNTHSPLVCCLPMSRLFEPGLFSEHWEPTRIHEPFFLPLYLFVDKGNVISPSCSVIEAKCWYWNLFSRSDLFVDVNLFILMNICCCFVLFFCSSSNMACVFFSHVYVDIAL